MYNIISYILDQVDMLTCAVVWDPITIKISVKRNWERSVQLSCHLSEVSVKHICPYEMLVKLDLVVNMVCTKSYTCIFLYLYCLLPLTSSSAQPIKVIQWAIFQLQKILNPRQAGFFQWWYKNDNVLNTSTPGPDYFFSQK
jgi:hypothetical protein